MSLRTKVLTLLAAATALTGTLAASSAPAGALLGWDASVTVTDSPDPVTPVGGATVYKVVARAEAGVIPIGSTLIIDVSGGGKLLLAGTQASGCTLPADGTIDPHITCPVQGATDTIKYVAIKSSAAGTLTNTSSISYDSLDGLIDDNTANDSDTETTTVQNSSSSSATYLQEGQSTTYQGHKLTVTDSDTGVIAELRNAGAAGALCGTSPCKQGLRVNFSENQVFTGRVLVDVTFGATHPCNGALYNPPSCYYIYYRKTSTGNAVGMLKCVNAASPTPCMENKFWSNSAWHVTVRMDSSDPDLLSPIKSLSTGTT